MQNKLKVKASDSTQVSDAKTTATKFAGRLQITSKVIISMGAIGILMSLYGLVMTARNVEWMVQRHLNSLGQSSDGPMTRTEFALIDNGRIISFFSLLISIALCMIGKKTLRAVNCSTSSYTDLVFKKNLYRIGFVLVMCILTGHFVAESQKMIQQHVQKMAPRDHQRIVEESEFFPQIEESEYSGIEEPEMEAFEEEPEFDEEDFQLDPAFGRNLRATNSDNKPYEETLITDRKAKRSGKGKGRRSRRARRGRAASRREKLTSSQRAARKAAWEAKRAAKEAKLTSVERVAIAAKRAERKAKWEAKVAEKKAKFEAWVASLPEDEQAQIAKWKAGGRRGARKIRRPFMKANKNKKNIKKDNKGKKNKKNKKDKKDRKPKTGGPDPRPMNSDLTAQVEAEGNEDTTSNKKQRRGKEARRAKGAARKQAKEQRGQGENRRLEATKEADYTQAELEKMLEEYTGKAQYFINDARKIEQSENVNMTRYWYDMEEYETFSAKVDWVQEELLKATAGTNMISSPPMPPRMAPSRFREGSSMKCESAMRLMRVLKLLFVCAIVVHFYSLQKFRKALHIVAEGNAAVDEESISAPVQAFVPVAQPTSYAIVPAAAQMV